MAVTISDVAKSVGVSPKTVSNVVHDYPHVRSSTRSKVLKAIEELGYEPNIAARSLVTNRHDLIGFVLWDILNPGYTEMVDTIVAVDFNDSWVGSGQANIEWSKFTICADYPDIGVV